NVIDNQSDHIEEHYRTVQELIKELDMSHIPTIVLFNKSDLNNELNYITNETYFLVNKFMEKEDLLNNLTEGIKDNYEFYTRNITMNEINELYELKQDTYVTNLTFNEDRKSTRLNSSHVSRSY